MRTFCVNYDLAVNDQNYAKNYILNELNENYSNSIVNPLEIFSYLYINLYMFGLPLPLSQNTENSINLKLDEFDNMLEMMYTSLRDHIMFMN